LSSLRAKSDGLEETHEEFHAVDSWIGSASTLDPAERNGASSWASKDFDKLEMELP
jgi:hypothetical protein